MLFDRRKMIVKSYDIKIKSSNIETYHIDIKTYLRKYRVSAEKFLMMSFHKHVYLQGPSLP